jgi:hypothetical protein
LQEGTPGQLSAGSSGNPNPAKSAELASTAWLYWPVIRIDKDATSACQHRNFINAPQYASLRRRAADLLADGLTADNCHDGSTQHDDEHDGNDGACVVQAEIPDDVRPLCLAQRRSVFFSGRPVQKAESMTETVIHSTI